MKKSYYLLIVITLLFSSCAMHNNLTSNTNNHTTEVVLSENNYKVIESVQGTTHASYVFGIGGLSKSALVAEARADMLKKADIVGGSKAIINETVEIKNSFFPFYRKYEVSVSGFVIEFTK